MWCNIHIFFKAGWNGWLICIKLSSIKSICLNDYSFYAKNCIMRVNTMPWQINAVQCEAQTRRWTWPFTGLDWHPRAGTWLTNQPLEERDQRGRTSQSCSHFQSTCIAVACHLHLQQIIVNLVSTEQQSVKLKVLSVEVGAGWAVECLGLVQHIRHVVSLRYKKKTFLACFKKQSSTNIFPNIKIYFPKYILHANKSASLHKGVVRVGNPNILSSIAIVLWVQVSMAAYLISNKAYNKQSFWCQTKATGVR